MTKTSSESAVLMAQERDSNETNLSMELKCGDLSITESVSEFKLNKTLEEQENAEEINERDDADKNEEGEEKDDEDEEEDSTLTSKETNIIDLSLINSAHVCAAQVRRSLHCSLSLSVSIKSKFYFSLSLNHILTSLYLYSYFAGYMTRSFCSRATSLHDPKSF